jgi:hypothetical protein
MWPSGANAVAPRRDAGLLLDAPVVAARDASQILVDAPVPVLVPDSVLAIPDASPARRFDAGVRARAFDAAAPLLIPVDAASPDAAPPPDAAARVIPAHVTLALDTWCELTIDGQPRGRASRQPIELAPGHHELACSQGAGAPSWSAPIELAPGEDRVVAGALLAKVAVTLDLDATIDGVPYRKGAVVRLGPGRHHVDGADGGWFSVAHDTPCHLRDSPELDCYP